jgi:hypothetical protein
LECGATAPLFGNFKFQTGDQEPGLLVILKLCRAFQLTPAELLDAFTAATLRAIRLR